MNWLAHLLLSEPSAAFQIGNLLPDLLPASEAAMIAPVFQRGMACHRRIDVFTDSHPIVRRSVRRVSAAHRRFGGILVDVFYDHFLSTEWTSYCSQPLELFVADFYDSFDSYQAQLPVETFGYLQRLRTENWLCSYRELAGVQLTLERIGRRLRRQVNLGEAVIELEQNYDLLRADFGEFFPQLRAHVESSAGYER
jgi:acyl carrier protein phosphodiesterase